MNWVEIGARIRNRRESFGYTRERFAEMVNITPKFCADIELGNKGMSVQTLCDICYMLDVSIDYIIFGECQEDIEISALLQQCTFSEKMYAKNLLKIFVSAIKDKHQ